MMPICRWPSVMLPGPSVWQWWVSTPVLGERRSSPNTWLTFSTTRHRENTSRWDYDYPRAGQYTDIISWYEIIFCLRFVWFDVILLRRGICVVLWLHYSSGDVIFSTYQTVLLVLILAFIQVIIISTLQMINKNLIMLIFRLWLSLLYQGEISLPYFTGVVKDTQHLTHITHKRKYVKKRYIQQHSVKILDTKPRLQSTLWPLQRGLLFRAAMAAGIRLFPKRALVLLSALCFHPQGSGFILRVAIVIPTTTHTSN